MESTPTYRKCTSFQRRKIKRKIGGNSWFGLVRREFTGMNYRYDEELHRAVRRGAALCARSGFEPAGNGRYQGRNRHGMGRKESGRSAAGISSTCAAASRTERPRLQRSDHAALVREQHALLVSQRPA